MKKAVQRRLVADAIEEIVDYGCIDLTKISPEIEDIDDPAGLIEDLTAALVDRGFVAMPTRVGDTLYFIEHKKIVPRTVTRVVYYDDVCEGFGLEIEGNGFKIDGDEIGFSAFTARAGAEAELRCRISRDDFAEAEGLI